jgi:hypothetical protein
MRIVYTKAQEEVFFNPSPAKFIVVAKGRRVGFTRGAAQAFVEIALKGKNRLLWGETIYGNVQRYFDLYFRPLLDQLPEGMWAWHSKLSQLRLDGSMIDFRSADTPENWEGFGYNLIYLNEAGIILKNPELLKQTVLPMLMDYPNSRLIAAGVPKGKKLKNGEVHPFYKLWEDNPGSRYRFSSYSNPFINHADIDDMAKLLDDKTRKQEIYGEFVDTTDSPFLYAFDQLKHTLSAYTPDPAKPLWLSFDFNVEPNSCIIGQQHSHKGGVVFDEVSVKGSTADVCDMVVAKYNEWVRRGLVYVTGDATGRNRNAMSGELTNYLIIKRKLGLRDYNFKVRSANLEHKASRVLCNSVLHAQPVQILTSCQLTISDCEMASVDASGDLMKDTGMHKLDCFRYMIEAWFPDYMKSPHKYL